MEAEAMQAIRQVVGAAEVDVDSARRRYDQERDRRVRTEGARQYIGTTEAFARFSAAPWEASGRQREPIIDHSEVLVVGGGFGGLLMGARLREAGFRDIRIIEQAGDFGGTWYWNRYPGAMCDIESLIYLPLLEETGYTPRDRYSSQPEILEHCLRIAQHYRLYDKATFLTSITGMWWEDKDRVWRVETDRGDRFTADQVVLACGRQSLPKLPGIRGIESFKGRAFHSSRWDYEYTGGDSTGGLVNLKDKRVAVLGTGATAIQIVPHLGAWAKELYVLQRTPSSVGVRANRSIPPDFAKDQKPGWQRERMVNFAASMGGSRLDEDLIQDGWTEFSDEMRPPFGKLTEALMRAPTPEEIDYAAELLDLQVMNKLRDRVQATVRDPAKAEGLKPWYRWACKRPCFHDEYLDTFNRPTVHLVDSNGRGVEAFTESGVVVDGDEYPVDCVVFATGFEFGISYTHLAGFEIHGRGGVSLSQHWSGGVRTLHGLATDRFPNLFFIGGNPQSAASVNAVHLLDEQSRHVAFVLKTARERGVDEIEAVGEAVDAYADLIRTSPKNKAQLKFYAQCTPGYYNNEGKAQTTDDLFLGGKYGDGPLAFFDMLQAWREDGAMAGLQLTRHKVADPVTP